MRALVLFAGLTAALTLSAQDAKAPGGKQGTRQQGTQQQGTKAPAPATKAPAATPVTKVPPGATRNAAARAADARDADSAAREQPPVILREVYDYESGGRRDPFISLLMSPELRPTVADLRLVGVLYDESGRRPVAIMRDIQTNTQYRVTTGMTLGRLRVALIKRRAVIFNIEEFGLNRQDSLVLGDSTKVRAR